MADHWIHADDRTAHLRDTDHRELEYAAGWTIAGLVMIGVIIAAWVFAI